MLENIWGEGGSKWATFNSVNRHGEEAATAAAAGAAQGGAVVFEKQVYSEDLDLPEFLQVR